MVAHHASVIAHVLLYMYQDACAMRLDDEQPGLCKTTRDVRCFRLRPRKTSWSMSAWATRKNYAPLHLPL
jgi:hypothetical protein